MKDAIAAFPLYTGPGDIRNVKGVSRRELFAAMAMQAIISKAGPPSPATVASDSVAFADALLTELDLT